MSAAPELTRTGDERAWQAVLDGLRADCLDCLQANLAALADMWHGAGTHLRLGAAVRFRARPGRPLPTAAPTAQDRLAEAGCCAGLAVAERIAHLDGAALRALPGGPWYVLADACHLPWVAPYYHREHMPHSFLLVPSPAGAHLVVDGYQIDTPAGSARPGTWRLSAENLAAAVPGETAEAVRLVPDVSPVPRPVPDVAVGVGAAEYVAAYRDLPDRTLALARLATETWTLARGWRLAAAWSGSAELLAFSGEFHEVAGQVYLAGRRVQRGKPEPSGWPDRLAALLRDAPEPEPARLTGVHDGTGLRGLVIEVASRVLGVPAADVCAAASLAEFPAFNSFRMLDIVEQLESALHVDLPADMLVPARLADVGSLAGLLASRIPAGPR